MKIKQVVKYGVFALVTVFAMIGLYSDNSFAVADNAPDYKIAITPTQKGVDELKPGESYSGEFSVVNDGKKEFDFDISFKPYSTNGEYYDADFGTETQYTEIADWLKVDVESGHLGSGERQKINYTVTVPEDAHGGSQSAAIMITMQSPTSGEGGIETTRQLAYLVYANIDGEVIKTGKVLENKVPSFLFNPPIVGSSLVENTGNVYTRAEYKLQVFPLFSDEEVYTNEETPENNIVFPETKRYNEIKWDGAPQLGIFKVRQTVKIFDDESVTEKLVFLCPIWFLFIVILLVFLIIFWIVSRVIKRKREA